MNKAHALINWENYPSINTPLNAANLNKLDSSVDVIDNRVVELDANKATKVEVNSLVADVSYDENIGIFTVTKKNGSKITIDTKLEKLAINFTYEPTTQQLVITLDDGTKQYIDLSALITQYEFMDTDTVSFLIDTNGKVSAIVKEGSIEEKHLEPNYLAKIKVEVAKGQSSAEAAALSEANAKASEKAAKVSETNSKASEEASLAYAQSAESCATASQTAKEDAETAKTAAEDAMQSAQTSASEAEQSKKSAAQSASDAAASRDSASDSRDGALTAQINASASAESAQKYATGVTDSAKYYYEQAKAISESFSGAFRPMGTLKFSELPDISIVTAGDMYNVSDEFVTTSDFKEGAGNTQSAGTNVYKTIDGKWDCLAGTPVTGIKGANESTFRRGNVNITPDNIGAVATNGDASNTTVAFTQASARENIETGETKSTLFGKIKKWFSDLKAVAFSGSYNDLSDKPSSLPASDVYSWAKASSKPSYSYNEIIDKPTIPTDTNQLTNGAGYITSSGSCSYASSAGNADTVDGHHFNWSGQSGQPSWLWGGNDSSNMYVYNPSNFSVNYANSAGSVAWSNVSGRPTTLSSFTNDVGYKTTDTDTWRPVQNNLTSDSTTDCLSAAMGKNLQTQINTINNNLVSQASSISYLESWRSQLTTTLANGRLSFKWNDSSGKLEIYIDSTYIGNINLS